MECNKAGGNQGGQKYITIDALSGSNRIGTFTIDSYTKNITVTVDAKNGATLAFGSGIYDNQNYFHFTIDVDNYKPTAESSTILNLGNVDINLFDITINGTLADDVELIREGGKIILRRTDAMFFSAGWEGKEGLVDTPNGPETGTMGVNAFATYDEASTAGDIAKSVDTYYNLDWTTATTGEVTVTTPCGTWTTNIGDGAYNTLAKAQTNLGDYSGNVVHILGGSCFGGASRIGLNAIATYITNATYTFDSGFVFAGNNSVSSDIVTNVTVGTGAYVSGLYSANQSMAHLTGGNLNVSVVDSGRVGSLIAGGYSSSADNCVTNITVDGGSVSTLLVAPSYGSGGSDKASDVNLTVRGMDSYVGKIYTSSNQSGTFYGVFNITLENASVGTVYGKGTGATLAGTHSINFCVSGDKMSYVSNVDIAGGNAYATLTEWSITINAQDGAGLTILAGNEYGHQKLREGSAGITIDVGTGITWGEEETERLVLKTPYADADIKNKYNVIGTLREGESIAVKDKSLYIVRDIPKVYFSAGWHDLEDGTTVKLPTGSNGRIGTDAFRTLEEARAKAAEKSGAAESADTYYNFGWKSGESVTINVPYGGEYKATVDSGIAFSDLTSASNALKNRGSENRMVICGGTWVAPQGPAGSVALGVNYVISGATIRSGRAFETLGGNITKNTRGLITGGADVQYFCVGYGGRTGSSISGTASVEINNAYVHDLMFGANGISEANPITNSKISVLLTDGATVNNVYIGSANTISGETNTKLTLTVDGSDGGDITVGKIWLSGPYTGSATKADIEISLINANLAGTTLDGSSAKKAGKDSVKADIVVSGSGMSTVKSISGITGMTRGQSITIKAGEGASLKVLSDFDFEGTITVDVTGFKLAPGEGARLVFAGPANIDTSKVTVTVTGTPITEGTLSVVGNEIYYGAEISTAYYSIGWKGLEAGTLVKTPEGATAGTIGYNAFGTYAEAKASGHIVQTCADTYYDISWEGAAAGSTVTLSIPGEDPRDVVIDNVVYCKTKNAAKNGLNTTDYDDNMIVFTGGSLYGGRTTVEEFSGKHAILYGYTSTWAGVDYPEISVFGNGQTLESAIGGRVIIAKGSDVLAVIGHRTTFKDATFSMEAWDDAKVKVFGAVANGSLTSSGGHTVSTEGRVVWAGAHSDVTFVVRDDASVSSVQASYYSGSLVGDMRVNVMDRANVGTITADGASGGLLTGNMLITLSGGVAGTINGGSKDADRYISIVASGNAKSQVGTITKGKAGRIDVLVKAYEGACLSVGGSLTGVADSITVDVTNFTLDPGQQFRLVLSASGIKEDDITVVGHDASKGYDFYFIGDNVYYGFEPTSAYFSIGWSEYEVGTEVNLPGDKVGTIGRDAFGSYQAMVDSGADSQNILDTYCSLDWKDQSGEKDIIIGGNTFKATIGDGVAYKTLAEAQAGLIVKGDYSGNAVGVVGGTVTGVSTSRTYMTTNTYLQNVKVFSTNPGQGYPGFFACGHKFVVLEDCSLGEVYGAGHIYGTMTDLDSTHIAVRGGLDESSEHNTSIVTIVGGAYGEFGTADARRTSINIDVDCAHVSNIYAGGCGHVFLSGTASVHVSNSDGNTVFGGGMQQGHQFAADTLDISVVNSNYEKVYGGATGTVSVGSLIVGVTGSTIEKLSLDGAGNMSFDNGTMTIVNSDISQLQVATNFSISGERNVTFDFKNSSIGPWPEQTPGNTLLIAGNNVGTVSVKMDGGSVRCALEIDQAKTSSNLDVDVANMVIGEELVVAYGTVVGDVHAVVTGSTTGARCDGTAARTRGIKLLSGAVVGGSASLELNDVKAGIIFGRVSAASTAESGVTLTMNGHNTIQTFAGFDTTTLTVGDGATLWMTEGIGSTETLIVDNEGFAFESDETSRDVLRAQDYAHLNGRYTLTDDTHSGYVLTVEGNHVFFEKADSFAFFNYAWKDLDDGTEVTFASGETGTIGVNAFATYDDAKAEKANVHSGDIYFNFDWGPHVVITPDPEPEPDPEETGDMAEQIVYGKTAGEAVTVETAGGTFEGVIGECCIVNSMDKFNDLYTQEGGRLYVTGGTTHDAQTFNSNAVLYNTTISGETATTTFEADHLDVLGGNVIDGITATNTTGHVVVDGDSKIGELSFAGSASLLNGASVGLVDGAGAIDVTGSTTGNVTALNVIVKTSTVGEVVVSGDTASFESSKASSINATSADVAMTDSTIGGALTAAALGATNSSMEDIKISGKVNLVSSSVAGTVSAMSVSMDSSSVGKDIYATEMASLTGSTVVNVTAATILFDGGSADSLNATDSITITNSVVETVSGETSTSLTFSGGMSQVSEISGFNRFYVDESDGIFTYVYVKESLGDDISITIKDQNFKFDTGDTQFSVITIEGMNLREMYEAGRISLETSPAARGAYDVTFSEDNHTLMLEKNFAFFSAGWYGLPDGTVVSIPDERGTGKIGEDSFVTFDKTNAKGRKVDSYFSYDWKGKSTGEEVFIDIEGGSFGMLIGESGVAAYADLEQAQENGEYIYSGNVLYIVGGENDASESTVLKQNVAFEHVVSAKSGYTSEHKVFLFGQNDIASIQASEVVFADGSSGVSSVGEVSGYGEDATLVVDASTARVTGSVENFATLTNGIGSVFSSGDIAVETLNNAGTIDSSMSPAVLSSTDFNNAESGLVTCVAAITGTGTMSNAGTVACGSVSAFGLIDNSAVMDVISVSDFGTMINSGSLKADAIIGSGTMTNVAGKTATVEFMDIAVIDNSGFLAYGGYDFGSCVNVTNNGTIDLTSAAVISELGEPGGYGFHYVVQGNLNNQMGTITVGDLDLFCKVLGNATDGYDWYVAQKHEYTFYSKSFVGMQVGDYLYDDVATGASLYYGINAFATFDEAHYATSEGGTEINVDEGRSEKIYVNPSWVGSKLPKTYDGVPLVWGVNAFGRVDSIGDATFEDPHRTVILVDGNGASIDIKKNVDEKNINIYRSAPLYGTIDSSVAKNSAKTDVRRLSVSNKGYFSNDGDSTAAGTAGDVQISGFATVCLSDSDSKVEVQGGNSSIAVTRKEESAGTITETASSKQKAVGELVLDSSTIAVSAVKANEYKVNGSYRPTIHDLFAGSSVSAVAINGLTSTAVSSFASISLNESLITDGTESSIPGDIYGGSGNFSSKLKQGYNSTTLSYTESMSSGASSLIASNSTVGSACEYANVVVEGGSFSAIGGGNSSKTVSFKADYQVDLAETTAASSEAEAVLRGTYIEEFVTGQPLSQENHKVSNSVTRKSVVGGTAVLEGGANVGTLSGFKAVNLYDATVGAISAIDIVETTSSSSVRKNDVSSKITNSSTVSQKAGGKLLDLQGSMVIGDVVGFATVSLFESTIGGQAVDGRNVSDTETNTVVESAVSSASTVTKKSSRESKGLFVLRENSGFGCSDAEKSFSITGFSKLDISSEVMGLRANVVDATNETSSVSVIASTNSDTHAVTNKCTLNNVIKSSGVGTIDGSGFYVKNLNGYATVKLDGSTVENVGNINTTSKVVAQNETLALELMAAPAEERLYDIYRVDDGTFGKIATSVSATGVTSTTLTHDRSNKVSGSLTANYSDMRGAVSGYSKIMLVDGSIGRDASFDSVKSTVKETFTHVVDTSVRGRTVSSETYKLSEVKSAAGTLDIIDCEIYRDPTDESNINVRGMSKLSVSGVGDYWFGTISSDIVSTTETYTNSTTTIRGSFVPVAESGSYTLKTSQNNTGKLELGSEDVYGSGEGAHYEIREINGYSDVTLRHALIGDDAPEHAGGIINASVSSKTVTAASKEQADRIAGMRIADIVGGTEFVPGNSALTSYVYKDDKNSSYTAKIGVTTSTKLAGALRVNDGTFTDGTRVSGFSTVYLESVVVKNDHNYGVVFDGYAATSNEQLDVKSNIKDDVETISRVYKFNSNSKVAGKLVVDGSENDLAGMTACGYDAVTFCNVWNSGSVHGLMYAGDSSVSISENRTETKRKGAQNPSTVTDKYSKSSSTTASGSLKIENSQIMEVEFHGYNTVNISNATVGDIDRRVLVEGEWMDSAKSTETSSESNGTITVSESISYSKGGVLNLVNGVVGDIYGYENVSINAHGGTIGRIETNSTEMAKTTTKRSKGAQNAEVVASIVSKATGKLKLLDVNEVEGGIFGYGSMEIEGLVLDPGSGYQRTYIDGDIVAGQRTLDEKNGISGVDTLSSYGSLKATGIDVGGSIEWVQDMDLCASLMADTTSKIQGGKITMPTDHGKVVAKDVAFTNYGTLTLRSADFGPMTGESSHYYCSIQGKISGYKVVNVICCNKVAEIDNTYVLDGIGTYYSDDSTVNITKGFVIKGDDCKFGGRGVSNVVDSISHTNKVNISGYGIVRKYAGTTGADKITVGARSHVWLGTADGTGTINFGTNDKDDVIALAYDHRDDVDGNTGKYYLDSSSSQGDVYISLDGGPKLTFVSETGGGGDGTDGAIVYTSKISSPSKIVYKLSDESAEIYGSEMVIRLGKLIPDPDDNYINVKALPEFTCFDTILGLDKFTGTGIVNLSKDAYLSVSRVSYSKMGWNSDGDPTEGIDIYNVGGKEFIFSQFNTWAEENKDDTMETAQVLGDYAEGWLYSESGRVMNDQNDWYLAKDVKQGTSFVVSWDCDTSSTLAISLLHADGSKNTTGLVADADGDYYLHLEHSRDVGMAGAYTVKLYRP
ncbi:MAG: hypothetical protein MJ025_00595 [Victivallaceae bacterium]|nr:hypothetical protein [Victivallaceae bacterium]